MNQKTFFSFYPLRSFTLAVLVRVAGIFILIKHIVNDKLRESATATEAHVSASWNDLQKTWREHVAHMRRDIDTKKTELDAKKAESRAENAEGDALFAIDYAYATVEEAEYVVLDAISARMKADELAVAN